MLKQQRLHITPDGPKPCKAKTPASCTAIPKGVDPELYHFTDPEKAELAFAASQGKGHLDGLGKKIKEQTELRSTERNDLDVYNNNEAEFFARQIATIATNPQLKAEALQTARQIYAVRNDSSSGYYRFKSESTEFRALIDQTTESYEKMDSADKVRWIDGMIDSYTQSENSYADAAGRGEWALKDAHARRSLSREALLAADIVNYRDSMFYREDVEKKMVERAMNISEAEAVIAKVTIRGEKEDRAVADAARSLGIGAGHYDSIVETVRRDYAHVRNGKSTPLRELADENLYVTDVANHLGQDPETVRGVIRHMVAYSGR